MRRLTCRRRSSIATVGSRSRPGPDSESCPVTPWIDAQPRSPVMIVDVHAHCWPSLDCFSPSFQADARRMRVNTVNLVSRYEDYRASTAGEDVVTLVFGGKARLSGVWIDDHDVA